MKIGILTFHQALNYGAVLQAYALLSYINSHFEDVQAEIIDYRCPELTRMYSVKNQRSGNPVKTALKTTHFLLKKQKFDQFIHKYIPVSKKTYDPSTICAAGAVYDKIIVGSDQVWNPNLTKGDMNYLLRFVDTSKRHSYAASIGLKEIPEVYREEYASLLNTYSQISVREASAVSTLRDAGVQAQIDFHPDPTLLLERSGWYDACKNVARHKKGYVLVYTVEYSQELIDEAVKFGKKHGLKVYYVGQYPRSKDVQYIPYTAIDGLLAKFRDASYVFTNSFHGTVLSTIFQRKFFVHSKYRDGRNGRITDLLNGLGLDSHMGLRNIDAEVNWSEVDEKLAAAKSNAAEYLKKVISYDH